MKWAEVAEIVQTRMKADEQQEIARVDIVNPNGIYTTEKAIKLVKDTFGVWTFVIGGGNDDPDDDD